MGTKIVTISSLNSSFRNNQLINETIVSLNGWVRTNRNNGTLGFIEFNDGTTLKNLQIVYDKNTSNFEVATKVRTGAAIYVEGKIILTPTNKQPFELLATNLALVGEVTDDYPLQKKRHTFEYLRDIAALRPRANTFNATFRVRNALTMAIHNFFQEREFMYVHTPIITGNDAEGAGATFHVTTGKNDPTRFFGKPVSLTVSGQLHVEAFALAFRNVYTFGPTFRAEESHTTTHASEFWMIEPEIAFADLNDDMDLIEDCIKYCIKYVQNTCKDELNFFNSLIDTTLLERLDKVSNSDFKRMTYTEAIAVLEEAVKVGHKFDNSKISWGMDLQTEHERYITEQYVKGPVFLTDYPKEIKAFYMRENDDGKTVAACDLLVPGVGELVGGSQREERYDVLKAKMESLGNLNGLEWYLDLRKFGGCPHAGFGIGFDRFLMYLTGMANIRDVQPFPRTSNNIKY